MEFDITPIDFNDTSNIQISIPEERFIPEYPTMHYSINRARSCHFFSIRRFTLRGKKKQIATIQRYKEVFNQDFIDMISGDFYAFIVSIFGNCNEFKITSLPPGNNKDMPFHLASSIGAGLADRLGRDFITLFNPYLHKNKNVGNTSNKQRLIMNRDIETPDKIILIDDVATTGASIEAAQNLLKGHCKMVIPVVWVTREVKI